VVRDYAPFVHPIGAQWQAFGAYHHTGLMLEAVPMDVKMLEGALSHSDGMRNGDCDIGFVATEGNLRIYLPISV
jgi:hypothetical protein